MCIRDRPYDLLDKLIKDRPQALDYVISEADGAKHHALKYPAADEPVIYPGTTDAVSYTHLDVYKRQVLKYI